ncbi:hypothetical protein FQN54_007525 [Arachnomyces sp. PD_36]|nr:hypothetical protein FQN54_007525 [Arachnomyces sp. PD_36]
MALRESSLCWAKALPRAFAPSLSAQRPFQRRNASSSAAVEDLEPDSSLSASSLPENEVKSFDPVARSRLRKKELPRSRYQFRSPKYDRGPLHPHRPPPGWDPSSRVFVPGPFNLPRVEQTYDSATAPDLMTLCYIHQPPGFKPPPKGERLRSWDDSSPYHKNRQLRGPRGGDVLRLLRKPITFNNIPKLERITVHSYVKNALSDGSGPLHVAGMAIQAITNVRVDTFKSKGSVPSWGVAPGKRYVSVKAELYGEDMYHFFGKLVDVVLPRIKDWNGVKGSTGDSSGNLSFGLPPDVVGLFPEIEVNYDMYPPRMIPGCHITVHTTGRADKDARLLLNSLGVPFYGKNVD